MTSEYDKAYNSGYAKGHRDATEESEDKKAALDRLNYLQSGGGWHRETTGDLYVQGYIDALKTLGVLK